MDLEVSRLNAALKTELEAFLKISGLTMEGGADICAVLRNVVGDITACGCLDGNVIKYVAVSDEAQGEGAAAKIVSELVNQAYYCGDSELFLFTKPEKEALFSSLGFYTVADTADAVFMENSRSGIGRFISSIPKADGVKGACVMNCNPFTLGHRHLVEQAAKMCDMLYLFVVSEDSSRFPFDVRYELVRKGTEDIKNVILVKSGKYLVSKATFPTYFIKDRSRTEDARADMDIAVFAKRIAKGLGITCRFVGSEPFCPVTRAYNERMKTELPKYGIELVEFERKDGISASRVRSLMDEGNLDEIKKLVPDTTYEYIKSNS